MKDQKKTFIGGVVAIILSTSCCWVSSVLIWFGGASILGILVTYTKKVQIPLILIGILMIGFAAYRSIKEKI